MTPPPSRAPQDLVWLVRSLWLIVGLTALRLVMLATSPLGLHGDEAQYWVWAQTPDWGYYSKPPLIAWIIWASTAAFGDTPFGVRAAVPVIHAGTALVLLAFARDLAGARAGAVAGALFISLPGITVSALLMTTDVPLLFCYALGSWCLWRALTANQWRWWLGFGAALGFGILAKFAAAMTLVSLALLLAIRHRAQILNPRLWAALGVAVLIYAPNLFWQLQHDFASYRHVGQDAKVEGSGLNLLSVAEFLGAQFGVFGPLLFAALIALLARPLASAARLLLAALILPQLVLMAGVAVLGEANANWAAMVYAPATVMVAVWAIGPGRLQRVVLAGSLALHLPLAILTPVAEPAARMVGVDLPGDPFRRLRGWDALGSAVAQALDQDPHAVLLVEERMLFAQLAFTVRPEPEMAMWNPNRRIDNHFELTSDIDRFPGRRFVLVAWSPEPTGITRHFEHWTLDRSVTVPIGGGRVRRHFIHRLEGYRGR